MARVSLSKSVGLANLLGTILEPFGRGLADY